MTAKKDKPAFDNPDAWPSLQDYLETRLAVFKAMRPSEIIAYDEAHELGAYVNDLEQTKLDLEGLNVREQTREKSSDVKFTTLDRPAPLSPELASIHRMMRRNEIERERQRQTMEREINELRTANKRSDHVTLGKTSTDATQGLGTKRKRSSPNTAQQQSGTGDQLPDAAELPGPQDGAEQGGPEDHQKSS